MLAGRDGQAGGTWLGVTTDGRFAGITNYRDPQQPLGIFPSRGQLVADYLAECNGNPDSFHLRLAAERNRYDGFNLIYGTFNQLNYCTNRGGSSGPIPPGLHTLSNHLLDSRWPKTVSARERLEQITVAAHVDPDAVFSALSDPQPFADGQLPDTGIGLERERLLSPLFIEGTEYGTRSTTVLLIEHSGDVTYCERCYDAAHEVTSDRTYTFRIKSP